MKDLVGVRFAPTEEELIIFYLMNKIQGSTFLVVDAINEINILNYEPMLLPSLTKIDSSDLTWYFFSPIVYADTKKKRIQRTLVSGNGNWKSSGPDRTIKGKRMRKGEIGIMKSFVYHEKGIKTQPRWTMHEYHITCLSPELSNYVENNYVICKVMCDGEDEDTTFVGNNQNDQSQSFVSSDTSSNMKPINTGPELVRKQEDVSMWDILANTLNSDNNNHRVQPEVSHLLSPNDALFIAELRHVDRGPVENLFCMRHDFNVHIPKKPLSGTVDYSSDSEDDDDAESELSYQGASSPDSVHNSNRHFLQTSGDDTSTKKTEIDAKQDRSRAVGASMQKKTSMVKTKKKSSMFIAEEVIETNHKNPRYIYLMNTMISFSLLLGYFGYIISSL